MSARKRVAVKPRSFDPVIIALAGLLAIASWSSFRVYTHTETVLETLQSGEGLALIITDKGIKSDSEKDERALSSATQGLVNARAESMVLSVACAGIALSLAVRLYRGRQSPKASKRP
jgi:hypothetical protein